VLKIYASGEITKSFTVEANHFTLDAIKAISDADGDSVMVR
jgi:ribosomal protein L15